VNLRQQRALRWLTAFALLITLVTVVGAATAADLGDPNVRIADSFYPCPLQTNFNVGPAVSDCFNTTNYQPLAFPATGLDQADCGDATSPSQIHIHRTTGSAFVPIGAPWLNGSVDWELTATIGDQDGLPVGEFQPFPSDAPMGSFGLPTGPLTLSGTIKIDTNFDSSPDIVANVSSLANDGNWGVCRTFEQEPSGGNPGGGSAPITGAFYVLNAGVLSLTVTSGPPDLGSSGVAEAYFSNDLATCCNALPPGAGNPPGFVDPAVGHFRLQFGSTHPAEGTFDEQTADPDNLLLTDFEGAGGVSVEFSELDGPVATTVIHLTDVPDTEGQFNVGDPPAVYDISASPAPPAGTVITICLPYGSLPAGATPEIKHYVNGNWEDVPTTSISGFPDQIVCGEITSFSVVAVGYDPQIYDVTGPFQPVDAYPTVNTMKAGRSVPVRFSLGGDYGLDIFADDYPLAVGGECSASVDPVETTTTNASGLVYDAASGTYTYNWKTSSSWRGQCRTLILQFSDGQELKANFKFN
jgi:hypothetical protein